jgi:hypothetical protein
MVNVGAVSTTCLCGSVSLCVAGLVPELDEKHCPIAKDENKGLYYVTIEKILKTMACRHSTEVVRASLPLSVSTLTIFLP